MSIPLSNSERQLGYSIVKVSPGVSGTWSWSSSIPLQNQEISWLISNDCPAAGTSFPHCITDQETLGIIVCMRAQRTAFCLLSMNKFKRKKNKIKLVILVLLIDYKIEWEYKYWYIESEVINAR